ncbi:HD domain-containing protein [Microaerobacter geothermalis]|uniref:HD domain-containing phosphohydrolase n=1 Tax=Microaerobacter geothermalis TaxID=674972 RepID=UPI001F3BFB44|nr:HD domain-containing phosphohydrolase [Microaerobacter geothermalis]MCF6092428.1 HD domain-containing protein [Microaerobacter geothermalis]
MDCNLKWQSLYQIANRLVSQYDLQEIFSMFNQEIIRIGQYDLCAVYMYEGEKLVLKDRKGTQQRQIPENHTIHFGESVLDEVIHEKRTLLLKEITDQPSLLGIDQLAILNLFAAPIIIHEQSYGVVMIGSSKETAFLPDEIQFLTSIVQSLTIAVNHSIQFRHLMIQNKISSLVASHRNLTEIYPQLVNELKNLVQFDGLLITIPHPYREEEIICYPLYLNHQLLVLKKSFLPAKGSATKKLLESNSYMLDNQLNGSIHYYEESFFCNVCFQSVLRLPLTLHNKPVGAIHLYAEDCHHFNQTQVKQLNNLAVQLSPLIEHVIRYNFEEQKRKAKKMVKYIGEHLLRDRDIEEILRISSKVMERYLELDHVFFFIMNDEELTLKMINHQTYEMPPFPLTDHSPLITSFIQNKTLTFHSIADLGEVHSNLKQLQVQSAAIIPLMDAIERRVNGILLVADKKNRNRFTQKSCEINFQLLSQLGTYINRKIKQKELERSNLAIVKALTAALDKKDSETEGHSERVVAYSMAIADALHLSEGERTKLRWGALLHDIGKIGIPDAILLKPGKLTKEEWEIMKKHPEIGFDMIKGIEFLEGATDVVLYHHERIDGKGYPMGLKGNDIPLAARIFAIADAFDAITSERPYKRALPVEHAIEVIKECSGSQFCPSCVNGFLTIPLEILYEIKDSGSQNNQSSKPFTKLYI